MKVALASLLLIILGAGAVLLLPDREEPVEPARGLPWQLEILPDGTSRVFGITLGRSTLDDALEALGSDMQLAIIAAPGEDGSLEVYYSHYRAGIISGKLILVAELDPVTLRALRERSSRDGGSRRYFLHPDDLPRARQAAVKGITFMPAIDLDAEIARLRFGEPAETVHSSPRVTHLLYPAKGLDFVLDQEGKDILQYVAPSAFTELRSELLQTTGDAGTAR
jgi:hypothetical protein